MKSVPTIFHDWKRPFEMKIPKFQMRFNAKLVIAKRTEVWKYGKRCFSYAGKTRRPHLRGKTRRAITDLEGVLEKPETDRATQFFSDFGVTHSEWNWKKYKLIKKALLAGV